MKKKSLKNLITIQGISEDEKTVTLQEEFEHKFNFR